MSQGEDQTFVFCWSKWPWRSTVLFHSFVYTSSFSWKDLFWQADRQNIWCDHFLKTWTAHLHFKSETKNRNKRLRSIWSGKCPTRHVAVQCFLTWCLRLNFVTDTLGLNLHFESRWVCFSAPGFAPPPKKKRERERYVNKLRNWTTLHFSALLKNCALILPLWSKDKYS